MRPRRVRSRHAVRLGALVCLLLVWLAPLAAHAVQAPPVESAPPFESAPPVETESPVEREPPPESPSPGTVQLAWGDDAPVTVSAAAAAGGVPVRVPEGASLGPLRLTATCVQDPALRTSAQFTVTRPSETTVRSPDPVGGTVTPVTGDEPEPSSSTWLKLAVLVVGLGAGLRLAWKLVADLRARHWVHAHVSAVARPAAHLVSSAPEVVDDGRRTHVVRLTPHPDAGTSVLEEV